MEQVKKARGPGASALEKDIERYLADLKKIEQIRKLRERYGND